MAAKFVLKKGSTGKFRFNLLATNGKVIATSEAYETKRAALGGIESVKNNVGDAAVDDLTDGSRPVKPTNEKATARATDESRAGEEATTLDDIMSGDDATGDKDTSDDDAGDDGAGDDGAPEPMTPPVDQSPALRNDGTLNLGLCHFGGADEPASVLATRTDGTGWIAVCEEHTKDAEEQGYVIEQSSKDTESES